MAANEKTLNKIHEVFADYILSLFDRQAVRYNADGEEEWVPVPLSAAELGVITKFLKDNNISFVGEDDDDDDLQAIRERAKAAAREQGFSQEDIESAAAALQYRTH